MLIQFDMRLTVEAYPNEGETPIATLLRQDYQVFTCQILHYRLYELDDNGEACNYSDWQAI